MPEAAPSGGQRQWASAPCTPGIGRFPRGGGAGAPYTVFCPARGGGGRATGPPLDATKKTTPADILARYKAKRKDRIFPVIVPLTNGRCICGMDFAIAQQSALEGGNVIECEHCRRFIYKE